MLLCHGKRHISRPHELLSIRLDDVKFKTLSSTGKQYTEVHIVDSKTKSRTLPQIFSVSYIKEWMESHPFANDPIHGYSYL